MKELYGMSAILCVETLLAAAFFPPRDSTAAEMVLVGVGLWAVLFSVILSCHGVMLAVFWLHSLLDSLATTDRMRHSENPYQSPSSF